MNEAKEAKAAYRRKVYIELDDKQKSFIIFCPWNMPAAPQGSFMLSHHLAQMSGNNNWYGHEGITWCGVFHSNCRYSLRY